MSRIYFTIGIFVAVGFLPLATEAQNAEQPKIFTEAEDLDLILYTSKCLNGDGQRVNISITSLVAAAVARGFVVKSLQVEDINGRFGHDVKFRGYLNMQRGDKTLSAPVYDCESHGW